MNAMSYPEPQVTHLAAQDPQPLLVIGALSDAFADWLLTSGYTWRQVPTIPEAMDWFRKKAEYPAAILLALDPWDDEARQTWITARNLIPEFKWIPSVFLLGSSQGLKPRQLLAWEVQDAFETGADAGKMAKRFLRLQEVWRALQQEKDTGQTPGFPQYKVPLIKRVFDIAIAGTALLMLSPLLILVMILIKLESRGPIFYISQRVGTGYKVFDFYKFRSMRVNADQMVQQLAHLNQYADPQADQQVGTPVRNLPEVVLEQAPADQLYHDDVIVPESAYQEQRRQKDAKAFFKIEKDPRITRVGHFIRNTSLDEIPQLINVLKGDMSVVGNRPLPLYEAEKLTTDDWTERFNAPAGITGLWQVTERGKSDVMGDSRKQLDVEYAQKYSIWLDLKIIFMTLPAMFQSSDV